MAQDFRNYDRRRSRWAFAAGNPNEEAPDNLAAERRLTAAEER
jgi:hypothetical protein